MHDELLPSWATRRGSSSTVDTRTTYPFHCKLPASAPAHVFRRILCGLELQVRQRRRKEGAVLPRAAGHLQKQASCLLAATCAARRCAARRCPAATAAAACQVLFKDRQDWLLVPAPMRV